MVNRETVMKEHIIVRRPIDLKKPDKTYNVKDQDIPLQIFSVEECYRDKIIHEWHEDATGDMVTKCAKIGCNNWVSEKVKGATRWVCDFCVHRDVLKVNQLSLETETRKMFATRLAKFASAVRKEYPELEARKSRNNRMRGEHGSSVLINYMTDRSDRVKYKEELKRIALKFNMSITTFLYIGPTLSNHKHDRLRLKFSDITPMSELFFPELVGAPGNKSGKY